MKYRCKNCGKYVSKDAAVCKSCGTENPAVNEDEYIIEIPPILYESTANSAGSTKYTICPFCGSKNSVADELLNEKNILCGVCGREMTNPYCKPKTEHFSKEMKIGFALAAIVMLIFLVGTTIQKTSEQTAVEVNEGDYPTPVWSDPPNKTLPDIGADEWNSNEVIYAMERKYNRTVESVFKKYYHKAIKGQKILDEEPLKSLIIKSAGDDMWRFMKSCKYSEEGVVKEEDPEILHYYYDCYKSTPDGDYFAMAFIKGDGCKLLFLEIQRANVLYNYQYSTPIGK